MNYRTLIPLVLILFAGYLVYTAYSRGQLNLPGVQPVVTNPPTTPITPTAPTTPTPPSSPIETEPSKFARVEQAAIWQLLNDKRFAQVVTSANVVLAKNPTDALTRFARERAINELARAKTFTFGISAPLTGALKQVGEAFLQGAFLAVNDINKAGGLKKDGVYSRINISILNDAGDRATALNVASSFIADKSVLGVVGPYSSSTLLAAAPVYNSGLPVLAPAATNPKISQAGEYIYRVAPSDNQQGASLARLVKARGHKAVAVLFDENDAYSKGLADAFTLEAKNIGLTTSPFKIELNTITQVTVGNYAVDAVFISGYTNDVAAFTKIEAGYPKREVFAGDGAYGQDLFQQGGDTVEGVIVTTFWHSTLNDAKSKAFTKKFEALFGGGTPNANAMQAYDAMRTMIQALARASKGSLHPVKDGLDTFRTKPGEGVTAPIKFDANGDVVGRPFVAIQAKNNKFVALGLAP
jgi:branched-chain amino acid transport system substrate-binding protein